MVEAGALAFLTSCALARWWTPWFAALASRHGLVAHPSARGVHRTPTPVSGGLTIVASSAVVLALAGAWPAWHAPAWIVVPALLIAALGVVDDAIALRWTHKLLLEAAIVAVAFDLARELTLTLRSAVGFVWVLAVTNAMNFIDNMDGLAPGQGAIALLALSAIAFATGAPAIGVVTVVVAGGCAGFFGPNFRRGAAFLGDAGSLLLGFVAGIASFALVRRHPSVVIVLAYPLLDLVFVVMRRCLRGASPMRGGTDHTSHTVAAWLGSARAAVTLLLILSAAIAACAVAWVLVRR